MLAIAHKVVSKAEGRVRSLADVEPGDRARALAAEHGKDPRHVQVILDESVELVRADRGRLICRTRHGFVCANAGVDRSNTGAADVVLLPEHPDASAAALRDALGVGAVVITDSWGRPWRQGQVEVAIGCAGLAPVVDLRSAADRDGRALAATVIAVADEVAAAADLVRGKASGEPAVRVQGLGELLIEGTSGRGRRARPPTGGRPVPVNGRLIRRRYAGAKSATLGRRGGRTRFPTQPPLTFAGRAANARQQPSPEPAPRTARAPPPRACRAPPTRRPAPAAARPGWRPAA